MEQEVFTDGAHEINHVNYDGKYSGDDLVCQVKKNGQEIAHCTWHPGSASPNEHGRCPYKKQKHCLQR